MGPGADPCLCVPQDSSLATGRAVIDLVDSIRPGTINYDIVLSGGTEEVGSPTNAAHVV